MVVVGEPGLQKSEEIELDDDGMEEDVAEDTLNEDDEAAGHIEEIGLEQQKSSISSTAILLVLGLVLVLAGFGVVVSTALLRLFHPATLFFEIGFGLFGAGIVAVALAWHRLS
jgi:hypothetical protein